MYHNRVHEEDSHHTIMICHYKASVDSDETRNADEIQNQTMVSLHTVSPPL